LDDLGILSTDGYFLVFLDFSLDNVPFERCKLGQIAQSGGVLPVQSAAKISPDD
jgi:hypothetical protein